MNTGTATCVATWTSDASAALHAAAGVAIGSVAAVCAWTVTAANVAGVGQLDARAVAAVATVAFLISTGAAWFPSTACRGD
jgi:hypothetical protein